MPDMRRVLPPLATLEPFEAAVRHRNFTRAAEELHLSQATVSRRIRELEADLETKLFDRHRYDVTPTPDAELLAASVRLSLGELSSTADILRRRRPDAGTLTIFSDLSLATALVAPIIGDFQRLYPDLTIRVLSSYEAIEETREAFDIGLVYGHSEESSYAVEPIADDAVFPVCSPDFAKDLDLPVSPAALLDAPLLHVAYPDPEWTNWPSFLAHLGVEAAEKSDGLVFTSYQICLDVAERGEGIALGWQRSVQARIDAGRLVQIPNIVMPHVDIINAHLPKAGGPNPRAEEFLAKLKTSLRPLIPRRARTP